MGVVSLKTVKKTELLVKTGSSAAVIYGGMKCVERMGVYLTMTILHAHYVLSSRPKIVVDHDLFSLIQA